MSTDFRSLRIGGYYRSNAGLAVKIVRRELSCPNLPRFLKPFFSHERYFDSSGLCYRACGKMSYFGDRYGDLISSSTAAEYHAVRYGDRVQVLFDRRTLVSKVS